MSNSVETVELAFAAAERAHACMQRVLHAMTDSPSGAGEQRTREALTLAILANLQFTESVRRAARSLWRVPPADDGRESSRGYSWARGDTTGLR